MNIIEKAKQLGLDIGNGSTNAENLSYIASQVGAHDLESLNEKLDSMLSESEQLETLDDGIESLETMSDEISEEQPQRRERIGDKQYNEAKNEHGVYDNKYYANKQKKLDDDVKKAKEEKNNSQKEVTKKNEQGEKNTVQKNKNIFDKTKDNINYAKARKEQMLNPINYKLAKIGRARNLIEDPLGEVKDKAKAAAKDAAKDVGKKAGKAAANAGKAAGKAAVSGIKAIGSFLMSNPYILMVIGILALVLLLIIIILMLFAGVENGGIGYGLYGYDYIEPPCTQITISNGEYEGVYDIEEYVAGVTYAEFGSFLNDLQIEAAKAGSIAARSYVLANVNDECTVESSQNFQVYKMPNDKAIEITHETRGLVLTNLSEIESTQYDAFCTSSPQDDPINYIVCQKEQLIPRSWVDSEDGIKDSWKQGTMYEAHGNGMSQWGAAYLAEQGYTFKEILEYYYDGLEFKSIYKSYGYTGEYPIDPDNELYSNLAFLIDENLTDFLTNRGTNVEDFNTYLNEKINEAGVGTRDGVVSAAVTLIGSLAELGVKLNYQWGGKYYSIGVNPNWGMEVDMTSLCSNYADRGYTIKTCQDNYQWSSFDCSGFVNWAIINGMQDTTVETIAINTQGGLTLSSTSAVCKPGGVLLTSGHIVLVVGIDEENKNYIVAESTGSRIEDGTGGVKLTEYSFNKSNYVCKNLDELYGE